MPAVSTLQLPIFLSCRLNSNNLAHFHSPTGKVVGHDEWGTKHKYYSTMSEATTSANKDDKLFTASTEAYTYIMVDNCYDKWQAMCKLYESKGDWKIKLPKKMTKAQKAAAAKAGKADQEDSGSGDEDSGDREIEAIDSLHAAKYSSPDGGQAKYGSFSSAGRKEHGRIAKLIKAARADHPEEYLAVEVAFLQRFRAANKIAGTTYEEQCKLRGSRKRKAGDGVLLADDGDISDTEEALNLDDDE